MHEKLTDARNSSRRASETGEILDTGFFLTLKTFRDLRKTKCKDAGDKIQRLMIRKCELSVINSCYEEIDIEFFFSVLSDLNHKTRK